MSTWKKIALAVIVIALVISIIVFWGSLFSAVAIMALVMIPSVYLYNRFINTDRENEFSDE